jgi:hypothetical protein
MPISALPSSVQDAARAVHAEFSDAFGANLHALYFYGAATFPESEGIGDLDFHVILSAPPTQAQCTAFTAAYDRLGQHTGSDDLDVWVISLEHAHGTDLPQHLIKTTMHDKAWALHRAHWLAGRCVVLAGPPPATIVTAPDWPELKQGLAAELDFAVADPYHAFAVLNSCRIVRSIADHDVVQSKFGSARWALEHLPAEHAGAIHAAANTYRGTATAAEAATLSAGRRAVEALASKALAADSP